MERRSTYPTQHKTHGISLTSSIGFAQLLKHNQVNEETQRGLERIAAEARRAAHIVRSLLDFARQRPPERKPVEINDVLYSTLDLLAYQLHTHNIAWTTHFLPNLPFTMADPQQLQQVYINLIHNARQAMSVAHSGGHLTITTNLEGEGTGLGPSVCHGIVSEHGGNIRAESKPGQGVTFFVELPVVAPEAPRSRCCEPQKLNRNKEERCLTKGAVTGSSRR